ncbi:VRR-NUC domain-containing protein [Roseovarius sp. SYSU LYC5161]|uniref:VRR-NUC domain-containing protein n=1 Tax=Roseovarius halophilus (ex Wu et al. 2025) TaxID=3376060 RepID=UPI00399A2758
MKRYKDTLEIGLTRHDRKRWSYNGGSIDVVEQATLDSLKDHGWSGYFTERFNYFALCCLVLGWPDAPSKTQKALSAHRRKQRETFWYGVQALMAGGRDGFLPMHDYSYDQIYANISTSTEQEFVDKLDALISTNIKSFEIGKLSSREVVASDIDRQNVISFFKVVGLNGILGYIDQHYPKEKILAMRRLDDFDNEFWDRGWGSFHISSGRVKDDFIKNVKSEAVDRKIGMETLFGPAFHFAGGFQDNIKNTRYFSDYVRCSATRDRILRECDFAEMWRGRLVEQRKTTTLDLQLWDDKGLAYAEVKAPNDRLSPAQKATLAELASNGERAMLINVSEN